MDIGSLTLGGVGLTNGGAMIEAMPSTPATAGVSRGFTTVAGFYPTFAGLSAFGYTAKKLKNIDKKIKGGK